MSEKKKHMLSRRVLLATLCITASYLSACSLEGREPKLRKQELSNEVQRSLSVASTAHNQQIIVGVFIDMARHLGTISPLIYGLAGGNPVLWKQTRPTIIRWGGTPSSRYNWHLGNAWNAARDWQFRNGNYGHRSAADRQPSGVADQWLIANKGIGASSLLTIPALGWVAKDDKNSSRSIDVPAHGGPALPGSASGAIAGYDPTANRQRTSVKSSARGAPGTTVAQQEWVKHFVGRFGSAESGGVEFYAIDNEPDLWGEIHTDVHPARVGYDQAVALFLEYALAIKEVDPTAKVTGPVVSGWTGYFYSGLDRGTDNFRTAADRQAHGGVAFLPWWLGQVHTHDIAAEQRTLDYLDVHYYPQGGEYPGTTSSAQMDALRLRSTRSLWDPSYVDESWIARTWDDREKRGIVALIPRLKRWVTQAYPGTKIAITEWNWGADATLNGALAIVEVLGIFGREGVDLATYWAYPAAGSPGAAAFQLYRNYDGHGAAFGQEAIQATSSDPDHVSAYAALGTTGQELTVILLNKDPHVAAGAGLQIHGFTGELQGTLWRFDQEHPTIVRMGGTVTVTDGQGHLVLPPYSATLLRIQRRA
jgi:hypothetical protein